MTEPILKQKLIDVKTKTMKQPTVKPSRWREDRLIPEWKNEGWTIRRHHRGSGKGSYWEIAQCNQETQAKQLALAANDGLSQWKYDVVAPDGTVWHDDGDGDRPLRVDIGSGVLRISIGIARMAFSAEHDDGNPHKKVIAIGVLAEDAKREMLKEREDGSTILTDLFDKAMNNASDNGSTAFASQ